MILRIFMELSNKVVYFTNTFFWVISRILSHTIVNMVVQIDRCHINKEHKKHIVASVKERPQTHCSLGSNLKACFMQ